MKIKTMLAALLLSFAATPVAMAADTDSHVHVAAFFKDPGQESFQWPDEINGEDIIGSLHGHADFLILTQTVGIHDGDVLNLQNDVLRAGQGTEFEDMGIDCQLSVNTTGANWKVGGKCELNLPHVGNKKVVGLITPHEIDKEKVWHHVWDDKETGVAVYFYKETGAVLDH
jgi:hypothetical protein